MGLSFRVDHAGGVAAPAAKPVFASEPVYADKQLIVSHASPSGIRFAGEIDASNSHAVRSSIAAAIQNGLDLHVDVTQLLFCDISGIRALVSVAEALPVGRRLLLHGMPPQLETAIRVVGWNRVPSLVVCECGWLK